MQNNANHSIFLGILSLILTIVITVGGAAFWLGGSIAATKASVDNNTKTLAALRTEMKADIAELRGLFFAHIGNHRHTDEK